MEDEHNERVISLIRKVQKRLLSNISDEKKLSWLSHLEKIDMNIKLLQESGIGETIRLLSKDSGFIGTHAQKILQSWKTLVKEGAQEEIVGSSPECVGQQHEGESSGPAGTCLRVRSSMGVSDRRRVETVPRGFAG